LALSPDGRTLVLWRADANRGAQLFVRQLDQLEMTPISGSVNANEPTFSPDGRWIAFVVGRQLFKVAVTGGNPIRLATLPMRPQGIAWTSGGEIVYGAQSDSLYVVKATGGAPRALAAAPTGAVARWPIALDQSNVVLFAANQRTGDSVRVLALSLADGKITDVGTDAYMAVGVARGHLVYLNRTGELFAAPFDARALTVTGPGDRVGDGVKMNPTGFGLGYATMSPSGDLVYINESSAGLLTYRDAEGRFSSVRPDTLAYEHPRFSSDGRRLVVTIVDSATSRRTLHVLDRSNGFFSPLAGQDPSSGRDRAEWTPDGRSILFRSITDSLRSAMLRPADGSGADTMLLRGRRAVYEVVLAPDEKTLLGRVQNDAVDLAQGLLWWTRGDSTLRLLPHVRTDGGTITGARFSPDGRWIAFSADASRHVYVAPFPGPGAQVRIDRAGGGTPVWAGDGRSVYYYTPTGLVATTVDLAAGVKVGSTREVLGAEFANDDVVHAPFDVGPDGTVVFVRQTRFPRVVVVRNFAAEIERAPAAGK
jgi:Tol biopolymer transport system component